MADADAAPPAQLAGSCLCGIVRYRVDDAFEYALTCHCGQCRRATGAAAKPFAAIAPQKLVIVAGHDALTRYGDEMTHDVHCASCGSLLYSQVRDGQYLHVTLGTLLDDPTISPQAHIFVGSKASWDILPDDGLPRFDRLPEG